MQEKVKGKGFEVVCHISEVPSADLSNLGEQGTCFEKNIVTIFMEHLNAKQNVN